MRVVEDNDIKEKEVKCSRCKSILAYTKEDIQYGCSGFRVHISYRYIKCPICNEEIRVGEWYE